MRRTIATWTTAITISVAAHAWSERAALAQSPEQPTTAALPDFDPVQATQQTVQQLSAALADPYTAPAEREEAARRLLAQPDPAAKTVLLGALRDLNVSSVAVARAVADSGRTDPDFIEPLFNCFTANKNLTDAAAAALGNYRNSAQVLNRLIEIASNRQRSIEDIRVAAIRALGSFSEKRAAEALIVLVRNPNESVKVRNKAADALTALSGAESSLELRDWNQWWDTNSRRSDVEFHTEMLERKASSREREQARIAMLAGGLEGALRAQYQQTPQNQREALLIAWLRAPLPEMRARAAAQVQEDWSANKPIASTVYDEMRKMIGDSSPMVRRAVVTTLGVKNDKAALEPLLQQLAQESDAAVRERIASALKEINDVRSAPSLVKLLNDPSASAVLAGIRALQPLGKAIVEQRPALAEQLAVMLRGIIERTATSGQVELRADAVLALVPLKQRDMIQLFLRLLAPREDVRVRIAALQALGEIRDHNTAVSVIDQINDPDDSVVLQAVKTLGNLAPTPDQANALQPLLIGERVRPDPTIKQEALHVLESILPSMSNEQLTNWADKFRGDPRQQIAIRLQLAKVLTAEKELEKLATTQSQIARNYMELQQWDAAVPFFRAALEYRQGNKEVGAPVDELIEGYMQATLNNTNFADAVAFAEKALRDDGSKQGRMGSLIRQKVDELAQSNAAEDLKNAVDLISKAKSMNPPLGARYIEELTGLQKLVDDRIAKLNQGSTGPRSANGFSPPSATRPAALAGEGN